MFCVLRVIGLTALKVRWYSNIGLWHNIICYIESYAYLYSFSLEKLFREQWFKFVIFRVRLVRQMRPETFWRKVLLTWHLYPLRPYFSLHTLTFHIFISTLFILYLNLLFLFIYLIYTTHSHKTLSLSTPLAGFFINSGNLSPENISMINLLCQFDRSVSS